MIRRRPVVNTVVNKDDWRSALQAELVAIERAARADEFAFYSLERHHGADRAWRLARVLKALEQRARRVALGPSGRCSQ